AEQREPPLGWPGGVGAAKIPWRRLAARGRRSRQGHGEKRGHPPACGGKGRDGHWVGRYARARRIDWRNPGVVAAARRRHAGEADSAARKGGGAWRIKSRCCWRTITR